MKQNEIIHWLKTTSLSLSHISNECGISRTTLHNWVNGSHKIRTRNLQRVFSVFKDEIELTKSKFKLKGGIKLEKQTLKSTISDSNENEIDANYILNLQKNEINRLREENIQLKNDVGKLEDVQDKMFEDITEYDLKSSTIIKFSAPFNTSRIIESCTGIEVLGKKLGYSIDEMSVFFMVGTQFTMSGHPIVQILHKETVGVIDNMMKTLPAMFNTLKNMIGHHYIPLPMTYIAKDGSHVQTMNYCNVNWKTRRIVTKTIIMS
jgi:hypothetical protein